MIFVYNKQHVGDVLLVISADDGGKENMVSRKGNVARITVGDQQVVGWNIFEASTIFGRIEGNGQVELTDEQLDTLQQVITDSGFSEQLVIDQAPKIVTGFVQTCEKHPDSDHLSITQTEVDNGEVLQIVCRASNIQAGLKVVVAKPGAMMPDGLLIWPGVLRGVKSYGMICSAKELNCAHGSEKKGILELPVDTVIGEAFPVGQ